MAQQDLYYDPDAEPVRGCIDRLVTIRPDDVCARCGSALHEGQTVFLREEQLSRGGPTICFAWCMSCAVIPAGEDTVEMLMFQAAEHRKHALDIEARAEGCAEILKRATKARARCAELESVLLTLEEGMVSPEEQGLLLAEAKRQQALIDASTGQEGAA